MADLNLLLIAFIAILLLADFFLIHGLDVVELVIGDLLKGKDGVGSIPDRLNARSFHGRISRVDRLLLGLYLRGILSLKGLTVIYLGGDVLINDNLRFGDLLNIITNGCILDYYQVAFILANLSLLLQHILSILFIKTLILVYVYLLSPGQARDFKLILVIVFKTIGQF